MIKVHLFRQGLETDDPVTLPDAAALPSDDGHFVWVDVTDPQESDLSELQEAFDLHPLTVEDARHRHQRPKVELFKDYAFVVLRPMTLRPDGELIEQEVHAFAGGRFLATLRYGQLPFEMATVVERWARQPEMLAAGCGFAVYTLADEVVDGFLSLAERLEDDADLLEDDVFDDSPGRDEQDLQERIFRAKRQVVRLRRFATPLRQGLDLLMEEPGIVGADLQPYYRDVMEHTLRVVELADNIRDLLTALLEVRIGQVANHTNEIMKKLTSWAAIILIPTLIAGIYGMNFRDMPELGWGFGYPLAIGTMLAASGALYLVFKRRGWL